MRDEVFDTVLIEHDAERLNCLEVLDAIRTGSSQQQPILVLGEEPQYRMTALCYESGADAYLCLAETSSRMLIWQIARASERHKLLNENTRLQSNHQHQLRREQEEATRLLDEQRKLVVVIEEQNCNKDDDDCESAARQTDWTPPRELAEHYREMLQAYVVMGAGIYTAKWWIDQLVVTAGVEASQALQMHVIVVESMIDDMGNRSARHVTNRANLLFTEVLLHLSEAYRRRLIKPSQPARRPLGNSSAIDSAHRKECPALAPFRVGLTPYALKRRWIPNSPSQRALCASRQGDGIPSGAVGFRLMRQIGK